ncbi:polysaccharide deacetylase family protein [Fuchsiella alkaliacetigena]|uniref:polysaccharide deacetylase family protein n=1 Tax=Fuchsiella alkaliacetigena TaxID=957042 RepID=UPI00200B06CD|nr:polysaccharide deacetylase family protein [Fuchsiella alkaliacetigena]MCK8823492.1 polysaccharide deacetylase family protein [Fuchsiella alkaliacetigena]
MLINLKKLLDFWENKSHLLLIALVVVLMLGVGVRLFIAGNQRAVPTAAEPYYQGPEDKEAMALTINVAWGQEYIPEMLDVLAAEDVKATFFFIGKWVEKYPELTQEIAEAGHEIGNHGYSHAHPNQLSKEELVSLIKDNEKLLKEVTGKETDLFAPPYGEYNDKVVQIVDELGYKTIMWTADTIDWQRPAPEIITKRVLTKADKGGIVLMHPTEPTVKALPTMIKRLKDEGYQLVTVSQLLAD